MRPLEKRISGSVPILTRDLSDGLRVTFENQEIVHLRPSGNAPELRCYCEAATSERANELTQVALGLIKKASLNITKVD